MKCILAAVLLTAACTAPALAADTASSPPAQTAGAPAAKPEEPKEKLVCTREVTVGSRMSKRVCRTASQVQAERRGSHAPGEQMQESRP